MMTENGLGDFDLLAREERQPRVAPLWSWPFIAFFIFIMGYYGVNFAPGEDQLALWWPAAGFSVLFVLVSPPWRRLWAVLLVFAVTTLSNWVGGRPPEIGVIFGIANALEVATIVWVLGWTNQKFRLNSLKAGVRFAVAVISGAWAGGLVAGIAIVQLDADQALAAIAGFSASHAAAVLIIVPFALLPAPLLKKAKNIEIIIQSFLLALTILLVFLPGAHYPLTFLPFPLLAWAAFRFPIRIVVFESSFSAILILGLTFAGGGPFVSDDFSVGVTASIVEALLVTLTGFCVILATAQYQMQAVTTRASNVADILNSGFVTSRVGLLVAEIHEQNSAVIWKNKAATGFLEDSFTADGQWTGPLEEAARDALNSHTEVSVDLHTDPPRTISVVANPVGPSPTDPAARRMAVQMLDVTATVQANRLQLAAAQAESAALLTRIDLDRQREGFVATTSHELRTPITSIVGYGELLLDSEELPAMERSWVQVITRNATRLGELVEDLLTLGKASNSRASDRFARTLILKDLVHDVASSQRITAEKKNVTMQCDMADQTIYAVRADISRVITNLVSNAIKFTPPGGTITISTASRGRETLLFVQDTGTGMTQEALDHAFERFYRAPEAEQGNVPGTGLGLSIVDELVRRNGGTVVLESPPDEGLLVMVTLPSRAPAGRSGTEYSAESHFQQLAGPPFDQ